jgi:hypothetical protein
VLCFGIALVKYIGHIKQVILYLHSAFVLIHVCQTSFNVDSQYQLKHLSLIHKNNCIIVKKKKALCYIQHEKEFEYNTPRSTLGGTRQ